MKDIAPGAPGSDPAELREVAGVLVFRACAAPKDCEVWRSDGSEAGTWRVADVLAGPNASLPDQFTPVGSRVFFTAHTPSLGRELWSLPVAALLDSDGDGLDDASEASLGTDPNAPDSDGDGLSDGDEVHVHGTDPLAADSDGDGFPDGEELAQGTNPLDPLSHPATEVPALSAPGRAGLALALALAGIAGLGRALQGARRAKKA